MSGGFINQKEPRKTMQKYIVLLSQRRTARAKKVPQILSFRHRSETIKKLLPKWLNQALHLQFQVSHVSLLCKNLPGTLNNDPISKT